MENVTPFTFTLEVLPDEPDEADPALVSALGNDVAQAFLKQDSSVEPVYTGERGGEFLVQIGVLLATAWADKGAILSDLNALAGILTPLVLASRYLWHAYERRVGKEIATQKPLAITVEINGISIKVEAQDKADATKMANELAQELQERLKAAPAQSLAVPRLRARVPKRSVRKRR